MTLPTNDKKMVWTGRILTGLVALGLGMSSSMKLMASPEIVQNFAKFGYPESTILPIGLTELACAVLFVIPQTAVLGALFVFCYLGGAVATHVQHGENFAAAVILGVLTGAALYARDPRVRELLPLRRL